MHTLGEEVIIFFLIGVQSTKFGEGPDFMVEKPIDEEGKLTYLLYNHCS